MTEARPLFAPIDYPETDGQPMTESDPTRDYLTYSVEVLRSYFQSRRHVYVSGNLFIYYQEGNPKAVISPDVFVIFGISQRKRRSYKTWQEGGKLPSFILEITSMTTRKQDEVEKPKLYASLNVQEYFQYDPTGDYLHPQLKGYHLVNGSYQPFPLERSPQDIQFIHSPVLGLDLRLLPAAPVADDPNGGISLPYDLRFYDPQVGVKLLNYQESEQARERAEQEREFAKQERAQAEQERRAAIPRLLALGLTPEQVATALNLPLEEIRPE